MNNKRTTIVFLSVVALLVLGLAIIIIWPFLKPFAFAIILAVVFYPVHEKMLLTTRQRNGLSALFSTLLVLLLFGVPSFIITTLAANEAINVAHYLSRRSAEEGGFALFVTKLAAPLLHFVGRWVDVSQYDIHAIVRSNAQKASLVTFGIGADVLGNLAKFTIDALITFVILFFLFREGKELAYRVGRLVPLSPAQVSRLYRNIADTIVANVYGILSVGLAQGILTGIAMKIVGMPSSLLLGLGAGFASIIPVVGSSLVWVPVAIYLLFSGLIWQGVFLAIWGVVVVSSADNIIRPWVVGGRVELHPMVLLFFILGGVEAFGFIGLFLGPVVASVLTALFAILREELNPPAPVDRQFLAERFVEVALLALADIAQGVDRVLLEVGRIAMRLQCSGIAIYLVDEEAARVVDMTMDHVGYTTGLLTRSSLKLLENDGHFVLASRMGHPGYGQHQHMSLLQRLSVGLPIASSIARNSGINMVCSRSGPVETMPTFAPDSFSTNSR